MILDYLFKRIKSYKDEIFIIQGNSKKLYHDLDDAIGYFTQFYIDNNIKPTDIILVKSNLSINFIALFLVLIKNNNIVIPLNNKTRLKDDAINTITNYNIKIDFNDKDINVYKKNSNITNDLIKNLIAKNLPGVILFTSGTSGEPKAILHDAKRLLESYKKEGRKHTTFLFMSHDHIGGLNTLLYNLFNGGTLIVNSTYNVDNILNDIHKHKITLLPTTPSFLNLMLLSKTFKKYDLSSLRLITYGTEPMDSRTLQKLNDSLPQIKIRQTYGMTEIGIINIKSKSSSSLEIKINKKENDYKIINDILYIKSSTSMIGYLNYDSPFTLDGWMNTGDRVSMHGEYIKILGRESELINVGGEKVYPIEVENILKEIDNISDAIVYAEKNRILGQIVAADIMPINTVHHKNDFIILIKKYCATKLDNYKIPIKVNLVNKIELTDRFKKARI